MEQVVHISYNDSICVAANSIFTYMWNSFPHQIPFPQAFDSNSELYSLAHDPEDLFE